MIYKVVAGCPNCPFAVKSTHPEYKFDTGPYCMLGHFYVKASYYGRQFVGGWAENPAHKLYTNQPQFKNMEIPSARLDARCPLKKEVVLVKLDDNLE